MSCYFGVLENVPANYIISVASTTSRKYLKLFLETLDLKIADSDVIGGAMTVAFMSLQIASLMGASEIIMLGQDLAYQGGSHVEGSTFASGVEILKINGKDAFKFEYWGGEKDATMYVEWVKGFYGEDVPTTEQFVAYINYATRIIKGRNLKVLNCTEGGAYIEGAEHISLKEAYKTYVAGNKLESKSLDIPLKRDYDFQNLGPRISKFKEFIELFSNISEIAGEGLEEVKEYDSYRDVAKTKKNEQKKEKTAKSINKKVDLLLNDYSEEISYVAEDKTAGYVLFKQIIAANDSEYSELDKTTDMKNKAVLLFGSTKEAMDLMTKELKRSVKRLEKLQKD